MKRSTYSDFSNLANWMRQHDPVRSWPMALLPVHVGDVQGRGEECAATSLVGTEGVDDMMSSNEHASEWPASRTLLVRGTRRAVTYDLCAARRTSLTEEVQA